MAYLKKFISLAAIRVLAGMAPTSNPWFSGSSLGIILNPFDYPYSKDQGA